MLLAHNILKISDSIPLIMHTFLLVNVHTKIYS